MDWFDQYLNGMGEYKVTVSPADTHQWGLTKPSRQQQSLMQDAMAFDVQQMRIIQEARMKLERQGTTIAPDPGSPAVQSVVYPEWNTGASYNAGDIVQLGGVNYECTATAGAGYGPFGGFLDGTENGIVYWSAYPIVNTFAYQAYPPGGLVANNNGNIPNTWVASSSVASVIFAQDNSVISIGSNAFQNNQITAVTIPDSVTSIGAYAFYDNAIAALTIGTGITTIGSNAFQNNQITAVTIPDSVTSIGYYAFANNALASVTIGTGIATIANHAFQNNQITAVTIPDSVTSIGAYAFANNQLTSVTIGNSVTTIDSNVFGSNTTLASISCFAPATAFVGIDAFLTANPLTIRVPATGAVSDTWTVGGPQSFQGNDNVTVIKDL